MTDIEQKALALVNEVQADWNYQLGSLAFNRDRDAFCEALCRAIERHEAFRQEVSDAVEEYFGPKDLDVILAGHLLERFIIPAPKPDPLVEAMADCGVDRFESWADQLRAALDARGLEIREKSDD